MASHDEFKETYQALQNGVGWYDLKTEEEVYQLSGQGHVEFLNQYNTQDIFKLSEGEAGLGCFLTQKGKLVAPATLVKQTNSILLILPQGCGEKLQQHLSVYLNFSECTLEDVSSQWVHGLLLGEGVQTLLEKFSKTDSQSVPSPISWHGDRLTLPYQEILIPQNLQKTWETALSDMASIILTKPFLEALRIQAGIPQWGVDMDENNLVAEVGLDQRATSFNKGCYLGQETTARVESQGHTNRSLKRFRLEKALSFSEPLDLLQEGQKVGKLTSVSAAPNSQETLGLGLIHRKWQQGQGELYMEMQGDKVLVEVL